MGDREFDGLCRLQCRAGHRCAEFRGLPGLCGRLQPGGDALRIWRGPEPRHQREHRCRKSGADAPGGRRDHGPAAPEQQCRGPERHPVFRRWRQARPRAGRADTEQRLGGFAHRHRGRPRCADHRRGGHRRTGHLRCQRDDCDRHRHRRGHGDGLNHAGLDGRTRRLAWHDGERDWNPCGHLCDRGERHECDAEQCRHIEPERSDVHLHSCDRRELGHPGQHRRQRDDAGEIRRGCAHAHEREHIQRRNGDQSGHREPEQRGRGRRGDQCGHPVFCREPEHHLEQRHARGKCEPGADSRLEQRDAKRRFRADAGRKQHAGQPHV